MPVARIFGQFALRPRGTRWFLRAASALAPKQGSHEALQAESDKRSLRAVNTALLGNLCILGSKGVVYALNGSSSILAEAVHSCADIANQYLLRVGNVQSRKAPDATFHYGYRREKFVWSLMSAVGIFCVGSGVSIIHGVHTMMQPGPIEHLRESGIVLGTSLLVESYSLSYALRILKTQAREEGVSLREHMMGSRTDPTTVAVVAEDASAVTGLLLAAGAISASHATGLATFDASGSIMIGTLLGLTATFLIQLNRRSLLGQSLSSECMDRIVKHVQNDPVVREVFDAKSEQMGPGEYRFKAEIEWNGDIVVQRYLDEMTENERAELMEIACSGQRDTLDKALHTLGRFIVSRLGDEVDRIEAEIQAIEPTVRHVDIETN